MRTWRYGRGSGRGGTSHGDGTQNKGESLAYALDRWHGKADGRSSCDYAFHFAMSDWNEQVSEELAHVTAAGIRSFKLYMTYDAMVVDDRTIYEILARLKELGAIAGVHCENKGIIDARVAEVMKKKGHREDVSDYPGTRPPATEAEAVGRLLKIARCVDTPVIVVHLSSQEGLMEVRRAREAGQTVYVETCPQYLIMDVSRYCLPDNEGRNYMIAPPLRSKEDQESLWQALREGEIQTVCTDHCSFTTDQMCRYLAYHPAKLYHLYPQKGAIEPGCDADIVVWNPETEWTLSAETQKSDTDYCPLEGTVLKGRAEQVYLRGELAAENGKVMQEYGGRYVTAQERTDIG